MKRHFEVLMESLRRSKIAEKTAIKHANTDFLPGVLEVTETPPNPVGRTLMWIILAMLALALVWSILGEVDVVATGQGKVIPDGRIKIVQASEQGVVRAIHVYEGEVVSIGDPLIELDQTLSDAEADHAREALAAAEVDRAREQVLVLYASGKEQVFTPPAGVSEAVSATQRAIIAARIMEYRSARESASQQLAQAKGSRSMAEADIARLEEQLPLVEQLLANFKTLESKGHAARMRVIEQEERTIGMRSDLQKARHDAMRLSAAESAAAEVLTTVASKFRREALDAFNQADATARLKREELAIAQEKDRRTVLRAPANGVVQQLQVSTVGAVVKPADSILVVVPQGSALIVEANILNRDIGFVREGQDARVKLEAFPFTRHGVVEGKLARLGSDAIQDEKLGLVFPARIELSKFVIPLEGGVTTAISPGMAVAVEIKTGKRRIIEFILSPLSRSMQEAGRER